MAAGKFKYAIIGFVVLLAIGAFAWGVNFLKGKDLFNKEYTYIAVYDKVDGLVVSSPILINGFKVGTVTDISFHPDRSGRLVVAFRMRNDVLIPDSSIARITSIDLMGNKAIEMLLTRKLTYYQPDDTLLSAVEPSLKEQVSIQMLPVKKQAENLMLEMQEAIEIVKYIFNANTRENLYNSFENIKLTVQNLAHSSGNLDTLVTTQSYKLAVIFANVESITANLKANNGVITDIIRNMSNISDSLSKSEFSKTIFNVNKTLNQTAEIFERINRGEGTLGMLLKNDSLYRNLQKASSNLDKLIVDIKENPKKYVRYSLFDVGRTINVLDEKEWSKIKKKEEKRKKKEEEEKEKEKERNRKKGIVEPDPDATPTDTTKKDVSYKIQIKSLPDLIPSDSPIFKGVKNIEVYQSNGTYRYCVGCAADLNEAIAMQKQLRSFFPDAFAIKFKDGKIISNKGTRTN